MDDKILEVLNRSLTNISQSTVDKYIEENVKFRAEAGLNAKIIRSTNGKCCKWCTSLAGVYKYPAPKEVYQRHDNCDCKVTYVTEKGAKDVHTKKILKQAEFEERLKLLEKNNINLPNVLEDVKAEYFKKDSIREGQVLIEEGVDMIAEKDAISNAETISKFFGDDIEVLAEINEPNVKTPDYIWNNKLWEQKTVSSSNAVDSAVRKALKQIEGNPGGIILDISSNKDSLNDIYKAIASRIHRRQFNEPIDIILIENEKIVSILRHKKI